jgi:hypothetical protein
MGESGDSQWVSVCEKEVETDKDGEDCKEGRIERKERRNKIKNERRK